MGFINKDLTIAIAKDRAVRRTVTYESHIYFFGVYFPHYTEYEIAPFQNEIFEITQDSSNQLACIVAFRGSAKSTIVTFSYTLWAILGQQQKKYVVIVCQTRAQAKQHMMNIRDELERNELLRSDLGPFREENDSEWATSSLVFENMGARITIASLDQSVRGFKHKQHRPDLIILDDVEDMKSTQTMESRNKTFDWFTREIIPLGDTKTRIILVGNLLHEDSLMMRLKSKIDKQEIDGIFKWFPLLDEQGNCLWPGKFDKPEKIEMLRRKVANELAWQQEYLLNIISDSTRVIHPNWIQYYDKIPTNIDRHLNGVYMGIDLAISLRDTADYTAVVTGVLCTIENKPRLYVLPNPINKRLDYPDVVATVKSLCDSLPYHRTPHAQVEVNGFQRIYADQLRDAGVVVEPITNTNDKRTRLALMSHYIREGYILFPKEGAEELIAQLTGFGREHHDDLADAFVMMATQSASMLRTYSRDHFQIHVFGGTIPRDPFFGNEKVGFGNIWNKQF